MNTKDIFCANDQTITPHVGAVDQNGEFVFTCETEGCGRFLKFAANTDPAQFETLLTEHEEANKGQVSVAEQEAKLQTLLGVEPEAPVEAGAEQTPPVE